MRFPFRATDQGRRFVPSSRIVVEIMAVPVGTTFRDFPTLSDDLAYEVLKAKDDALFEYRDGHLFVDGNAVVPASQQFSEEELRVRVLFLSERHNLREEELLRAVPHWSGRIKSGRTVSKASLLGTASVGARRTYRHTEDASLHLWRTVIAERIIGSRAPTEVDTCGKYLGRDPLLNRWPLLLLKDQRWCSIEAPFPWLPERLPISEVYTELSLDPLPLKVALRGVESAWRTGDGLPASRFDHVSTGFALDRLRGWGLILAAPGGGKTTLMNMLAAGLMRNPGSRFLIPVLIRLRDYWRVVYGEKANPLDSDSPIPRMLQFFLHQVGVHDGRRAKFWNDVVHAWSSPPQERGEWRDTVLFLLDGWDEIPPRFRERILLDVEALMPLASGLITSRPSGFPLSLPVQHCFELAGLDPSGVVDLTTRWFAAMHRPEQARTVLDHVRRHPDLTGLAANPFLLTLICGIAYHNESETASRLPQSRTALYHQSLEAILRHTRRGKNLRPVDAVGRKTIERFALWLLQDADSAPRHIFSPSEFDDHVGQPGVFFREWEPRRLLTSSPASPVEFQFLHTTIQEYLAAKAWVDQDGRFSQERVQAGLLNTAWFEVFRFAAGQSPEKNDAFWNALRSLVQHVDRFGMMLIRLAHAVAEAGDRSHGKKLLGVDLFEQLWRHFQALRVSPAPQSGYVDALVALDAAEFVRRLEKAVRQTQGENRDRFMHAFDRVPSKIASSVLSRLISDEDPKLKSCASRYADKLAEEDLAEHRKTAADQGLASTVRIRALLTLAYAKDRAAIPMLGELIRDDADDEVVLEAIETMGSIGGEASVEKLAALLDSETDFARRLHLWHALGSTEIVAGRDRLLWELAIRAPDDKLLEPILEALQGVPLPRWGGLLAGFLDPKCPKSLRLAAINAISDCTDFTIVPRLIAVARDDTDAEVRETALQNLLWVRDPSIAGWLRERYHRSRRPTERARCLDLLVETAHRWGRFADGQLVFEAAFQCVREALRRPDSLLAEVAARNAHLLGESVIPLLLPLLTAKSVSIEVRYWACESLGRLEAVEAAESLEIIVQNHPDGHADGKTDEQSDEGVTEEMVVAAAAEALALIAPCKLLKIPGAVSREALAHFSMRTGHLVFKNYILDPSGRRLPLRKPAARCAIEVEKTARGHVFLSYAHVDRPLAERLRKDLRAAGEQVWWDEDILPGQDWKAAIRDALKRSYAVVACFTAEAVARARSGMQPELLDAIDIFRHYTLGSIFIVPVRFSECVIPPLEIDATRTFDRLQYVDLFPRAKRAAGLKRLLAALQEAPYHP